MGAPQGTVPGLFLFHILYSTLVPHPEILR